jgi:circadian clock protein KaiC
MLMAEPAMRAIPTTKIPTGITGFDAMTGGGLPSGRVCATIGAAGTGKTVFAMQVLVNRLRETDGVGVFVSFEQSLDGLIADLSSFDWDAMSLVESGKLILMDGRPHADILISGTFDIVGLLATVEGASPSGAPTIAVFDGIDALLTMLASPSAQRGELLRLQDHLSRLGSAVILTVKAGPALNTGFEEIAVFMADCVIELARETEDGVSNRSIRIQKYRSSGHAQNWVPFVMTKQGIEVQVFGATAQPIPISNERLSMGIARLDEMLSGGVFRGSSTLLSGSPGTSKTTLGTRFIETVCKRGERALCICFDEAPEEVVRNVASVATDLGPHIASGLLRMHVVPDRSAGPNELVYEIIAQLKLHRAQHLLVDPISVFSTTQNSQTAMGLMVQFCKREGITVILTSLLDRSAIDTESSRSYVSTLCDTWIHLSYVVQGGERNRALTLVKSRGTAHSNQVGELLLGSDGITIADVYTEDGVVLMGSLRWQRERANQKALHAAEEAARHHYREIERSADDLSLRIAALGSELEGRQQEMAILRGRAVEIERLETERRDTMSRLRSPVDVPLAHDDDGSS